MTTTPEQEVNGTANMTTDRHAEFQVRLSKAETEVNTWCIADMDHVLNELETEIHGITSNKQMQFKK